MAMVVTLAAMSIPVMGDAVEFAYVAQGIGDIRTLQTEITRYEVRMGVLPVSLQQAGVGDIQDPWGNPYRYLDYATAPPGEKPRKDKFLKPINSSYDLYSLGRDGVTKDSLNHKDSADDVVRANDGAFIGLAAEF